MAIDRTRAEEIRKGVDGVIDFYLTKREAYRLKAKLGEVLGAGADGYVLGYGPTRVIKFCKNPGRHTVKQIRDLVGRLRGERIVVRVHEVRRLGNSYYMIMERLNRMTKTDLNYWWKGTVWDSFMANRNDLYERKRLYHADFHSENVMKRNGKWVLVDVESFLY